MAQQLCLFDVGYPPRPRSDSSEIISHSIEIVTQRILEHLNVSKEKQTEIGQELKEAFSENPDPAKVSRLLIEDFMWVMTPEVFDLLSAYESIKYTVHHARVMEWVSENGVAPRFQQGQWVRFQLGDQNLFGTVQNVLPKIAKYVLSCEDLPNLRRETRSNLVCLPYEEVQSAEKD